MRLWGIRAAIVVAAIAMNVIEVSLLHPLLRQAGLNVAASVADDCLVGLAIGVVICFIHAMYRRHYHRALQIAVDQLNHHVRNSMQVILTQNALCPNCDSDHVFQALQRVDWALREVLPPEIQPEPQAGRAKASHSVAQ